MSATVSGLQRPLKVISETRWLFTSHFWKHLEWTMFLWKACSLTEISLKFKPICHGQFTLVQIADTHGTFRFFLSLWTTTEKQLLNRISFGQHSLLCSRLNQDSFSFSNFNLKHTVKHLCPTLLHLHHQWTHIWFLFWLIELPDSQEKSKVLYTQQVV